MSNILISLLAWLCRPLEAPKDCPAGIRDLMAACMLEKPSARPSARELFESVRDTMQQVGC